MNNHNDENNLQRSSQDLLPCVLTLKYDDAIKSRARTVFHDQPLQNSHRGIDARIIGAIGEAAFELTCEKLSIPLRRIADKSTVADYVLESGALVEVKSKQRSVRPRIGFEASRPQYNESHQRVDFYVFVSVLNPTKQRNAITEVAVLGAISCQEFEQLSYEVELGSKLGSGRGAWTAMRNIKIEQLKGIEILKSSED